MIILVNSFRALWLMFVLSAIGCATSSVHSTGQLTGMLDGTKRWVLLPMQNLTETPQAGESVEAILATLLRAQGIINLSLYPTPHQTDALPEFDERRRYEEALRWARDHNYTYGVTGSVEEWRYKSGVDGEAAVGISIQLLDIGTEKILWSASGARAGWGRETLSGATQRLLLKMLRDIRVGINPQLSHARPQPSIP
jgi:hypothetical protein